MKEVYKVTTDDPNGSIYGRSFWVVAASPGRAITKLKRKGRKMLDRGEKITGVTHAGTIDVE